MLAELPTPSTEQLGLWISIALSVYVIYLKYDANRIAKDAATRQADQAGKPQQTIVSPQPLTIEVKPEFITRKEVEKQIGDLKADVDGRLEHIEQMMDDRLTTIDNKRDRQVGELHEKINEANATLNYIRGVMDCRNGTK